MTGLMGLFRQVATAIVLITLTLSIQSGGMAVLILWARAFLTRSMHRFGLFHCAELMVRFTSVIVNLHILQILLWTVFYRWKCFPSFERALYFSAVSYSTVGYGDVILPATWRLLGPLESVTGVLMCGLSAGLLFALVTRLVGHEERFLTASSQELSQGAAPAHPGAAS
jgi:voltage-gated potassium channel